MAEEIADIGSAAALVTRARPQGFGFVQGLKMAETSALNRARLEAASAAKKQAKLDKMMQYTTKVDRLKEPYTQKKANEMASRVFAKKAMAAEAGDIQAANEAEFEYNTYIPYILQEDEKLHAMNPYVNKEGVETVTDVYKAYNQGGLEAAVKVEPSWLPVEQRIIQPTVDGNFAVRIPKKIDLDNAFSGVIKRFLGDDLVLSTSGKITTSSRKLRAEEVIKAAKQLYDDPNYIPYLLHSKDFRKYYEDNYSNGNPERLKDEAVLDRAIDAYTRERLSDYNDERITKKEKNRGGVFIYNNGNSASTGKYDFSKQTLSTSDFAGTLANSDINFGDANFDNSITQKTKFFIDNIPKSGNVDIIQLPQDASFTMTLTDKNRSPASARSVKPLKLVKTSDSKMYLIYGDGNDSKYTTHIVQATGEIMKSLESYYSKDSAEDVREALSKLGVNTDNAFSSNQKSGKGKASGSTLAFFKKN